MTKAGRLEEGGASKVIVPAGSNKGISVMDLILRLVGIAGTLGAAIAMGTNEQTLPFFTRFVRFNAQYDDFKAFRLFVVVNAILSAYFVLTIPLSIVHIMRSVARGSRILLIILDTEVYDRDTFSMDDKMGYATFDIQPFLEAVRMRLGNLPNGTIITTVKPTRTNCLAEESHVTWTDGKVIQNMVLRLQNVECGEIEIQLSWIDIPGSRGL